ncbi:MAG: histidine phosphatase family protein [Rhodospirillales bacterium]|nr:histidine phosphatase family protein [Rhodospirillales bacterium]
MTKIYMVRHGEAAATWGKLPDPGLSDLGRQQAQDIAKELHDLGPLPILTSPMQRAQQTATPFEQAWKTHAIIEPAITEIPTPDFDMEQRQGWLKSVMEGNWSQFGDQKAEGTTWEDWRQGVINRLLKINEDTLLTTHFISINVAVGWALGDDRVVNFKPDNASCTVLEIINGKLKLITLGKEAQTEVG